MQQVLHRQIPKIAWYNLEQVFVSRAKNIDIIAEMIVEKI